MAAEVDTNAESREGGELLFIDWGEVYFALRRRQWWILGTAVLLAVALGAYAMRKPKIYQATAALIINPGTPRVLGDDFDVEDLARRASAEVTFYNTQYEVMQSRSVFREAIERLGLRGDRSFLQAHGFEVAEGPAAIKDVEKVLRDHVEVVPEPKNRIVRLVVRDTDADRAAKIANAVAQAYKDQSLQSRVSTTRSASRWLDERVDEFSAELEATERTLADFKRENMLVSVSLEDRSNTISRSLATIDDRMLAIRDRLIVLESERRVISRAKDSDGLLASPRMEKNDTILKYKALLADLEQKRGELVGRYGPKMPPMVEISNQIQEMKQAMLREAKRSVAVMQNEIAELQHTLEGLKQERADLIQRATSLNSLAIEYNKLSQELTTKRDAYNALLKRRTESDLSAQDESNFVSWHEQAEAVYTPVAPSVTLHALLGALFGLLASTVAVFGTVLLDNNVHSEGEIEGRLKVPFLGLLPSIPAMAEGADRAMTPQERDMYVVSNPKSNVAECARSVRTNLMFLGADTPLKTLLLTSAGPSEGKSTMAIALSSSMAQAGNRVLLIDTDLRRPRLHRAFGLSNEHGLTNALFDRDELDQALKPTEVRGLDLLPCGPLPPNPSELLHTERFHALLKEVISRYDRVILDSPPVNLVTDAAILSQITEGTILVVKAGKTGRDAARRAVRQLRDLKANLLGAVLNDVDLDRNGYYGQRNYYYYRSNYTYGATEQSSSSA